MNAHDVETGWLHQQSLDGVTNIVVDAEQVDLTFEADPTLSSTIQLIVEPAQNLPTLQRSGSDITISQTGRFRGRVTPLVRVPALDCPNIEVKLGKGDVSLRTMRADIAVRLGMGDVEIDGGSGPTAIRHGKGSIELRNRDGDVAIKLGMGDIAIDGCRSAVAVSLGKGDIALTASGTAIDVKNGYGDVAVVGALGGTLFVNTGNGDVAIVDGEVSRATVRTGKGDISSTARLVTDAAMPAPAPDEDEFDEFDDFDANESFSLRDVLFEANDEGVRIGRGGRDILKLGPDGIQIHGSNREISLGPDGIRLGGPPPDAGEERFSFDTERGDIHVALPNDLNMRVEVLATGDVQSDIPLVSVARPGPRGTTKRLVGVTDGAASGPRLNVRARTKRGDVSLRSVRVQPRVQPVNEPPDQTLDRDEQARVILEALARGDLSINEAERLLEGLDRAG